MPLRFGVLGTGYWAQEAHATALAGMLADVFGFDMTVEWGGCAGCGATNQLGALLVYAHGMGAVASCPSCGRLLLRIAHAHLKAYEARRASSST